MVFLAISQQSGKNSALCRSLISTRRWPPYVRATVYGCGVTDFPTSSEAMLGKRFLSITARLERGRKRQVEQKWR